MHLLKCFDKYRETPASRESVDQKLGGDDSASPRVTPIAPTPLGRAPEGSIYNNRLYNVEFSFVKVCIQFWRILYM